MKECVLECLTVGSIETNCWIYAKQEFYALIDPGDDAPNIITFLKEKNLTPAYILLTHGHLDHLAALPDLAAAFTELKLKPRLAIHKDDSCYLGSGSFSYHRDCMIAAGGSEAYIKSLWKPMPDPDMLLSEADTIGPFKVLHLPGHSPGSAAYYDEEGGILFSGDTLFCGGVGRTDLPGGNRNQLEESLKRLLALDENITVCPGHGTGSTIGVERSLPLG